MALKGIEKVVNKFCVQTAVYWGNPQNDGFGHFTFDDPVELKPSENNGVRWEGKSEVNFEIARNIGNIQLSKSSVLVLQDLDEMGYLFLGTLEDIDSSADESDPLTVEGAYPIRRFDKIPMVFKTNEFVRIAYLYDKGV